MKKTAALFCALALSAGMACPAQAASGPIRTVYDAGSALLFSTPDVTVQGDVTVARNGEVFKTVHGDVMQKQEDSAITLSFSTLRPDGRSYDSLWHVTAQDGTAFSVDSLGSGYYSTHYASSAPALVNDPDGTLSLLLSLVGPGLEMADLLYPDAAERTKDADGEKIRITFEKGEAPRLLSEAASALIRYAAKRYMGLYLPNGPLPEEETIDARVLCDDWDLLFRTVWKEVYGTDDAPAFESEWSEEDMLRSEAVYERINAMTDEAEKENSGGYSLIRAADCSVTRYDTYAECLVAAGGQYILYQDASQVFLAWLKERTGDEWDEDTLQAAWSSNNAELWEALNALNTEMEQEYIAQLGNAPAGYVDASGVLTPIPDPAQFALEQREKQTSTAYSLLAGMKEVRLEECDASFTLDGEGRLTGGEGTIDLYFVRWDEGGDTVTVTFSFTADSYGTTEVAPFDPEKWNVVSWQEWADAQAAQNAQAPAVPDPLTLNGKEYPLLP